MFSYTIKVTEEFDAAHRLIAHEGKCHDMHGHRWVVDMEIQFDTYFLPPNNMLMDFGKLKGVVRELDHTTLNDLSQFDENPTAEAIATWIMDGIIDPARSNWLIRRPSSVKVTVHESPECSVTLEAYVEGDTKDD